MLRIKPSQKCLESIEALGTSNPLQLAPIIARLLPCLPFRTLWYHVAYMTSLDPHTGVILVDHGSELSAANDMLVEIARMFSEATGVTIVEPAHMDLAEPTLAQAFASCVARGATQIVVHPYFLSPGRHSMKDIPLLSAEAAKNFPDVPYCVSEPLGVDNRLVDVVLTRVLEARDQLGKCDDDDRH